MKYAASTKLSSASLVLADSSVSKLEDLNKPQAQLCKQAFPIILMGIGRIVMFSVWTVQSVGTFFCRFNAESVQQTERRWRDGSLEEDLPMRSLSEMFNVNYFLVSQTNPHIVPALNLKKRVNRTLGNVVETEWKHR